MYKYILIELLYGRASPPFHAAVCSFLDLLSMSQMLAGGMVMVIVV